MHGRPNNKIGQSFQNYTQREKWVWSLPLTPTSYLIHNPPFLRLNFQNSAIPIGFDLHILKIEGNTYNVTFNFTSYN